MKSIDHYKLIDSREQERLPIISHFTDDEFATIIGITSDRGDIALATADLLEYENDIFNPYLSRTKKIYAIELRSHIIANWQVRAPYDDEIKIVWGILCNVRERYKLSFDNE